jgi:hypothetical protein
MAAMLVMMGAESWPEPTEQPTDRGTLREYEVDARTVVRWREAATPTWARGRRSSASSNDKAGDRPPATTGR